MKSRNLNFLLFISLFFTWIDLDASVINFSNYSLPMNSIVRDTGDVLYLTQASLGIIETGSYTHPFISLEGAMNIADDGDNIIFLRGSENTYKIDGPLLLSKNVLITAEYDDGIWRLGDGEPFLPVKGIPLIIE